MDAHPCAGPRTPSRLLWRRLASSRGGGADSFGAHDLCLKSDRQALYRAVSKK